MTRGLRATIRAPRINNADHSEAFWMGQRLQSSNGRHRFTFEQDNRLVLRDRGY